VSGGGPDPQIERFSGATRLDVVEAESGPQSRTAKVEMSRHRPMRVPRLRVSHATRLPGNGCPVRWLLQSLERGPEGCEQAGDEPPHRWSVRDLELQCLPDHAQACLARGP
jgi:hypothetical protein